MISERLKNAFTKCAHRNEFHDANYSIPLELALANVVAAAEQVRVVDDRNRPYIGAICEALTALDLALKEIE